MSKKQQSNKNADMSQKLIEYMLDHPALDKKHGKSSYVVFVDGDEKLNKMNLQLVESVKKEDKNVIMATFTGVKSNPWRFEFAS